MCVNDKLIVQLIPYDKMESIVPLAFELNRGKITHEVLENRLKKMLKMGGYECVGVYDNDELIGICGVWILYKLYAGKHIEPDNVFVKKEYRSRGVGELMLDYVFEYAKKIGCEAAEVNFYVANKKGQQFWERQGFESLAIHGFKKFNQIK
ncbi:GNAT family N-acetyltransferase [Croceitalea rosinachiae]|uniref:GNAT family N-acetyltransferase n=1 Tax=Croceitalea rosinachiae TaxID=3075596 RepID=A0ABU3ABC9_9FLAO|nr:GNAT family N-acetyltransferase [Croceitalea sp. F388]MDT0607492.1 GNAT family N-acetyltransferase [Croceitalea sp. F388]